MDTDFPAAVFWLPIPNQFMSRQPLFDFPLRLLHERPHWQTIDETARPLRILKSNTVPKPREHDGGGFAETGRNIDELRMASRARIVPCQTGLVVIGRVARGGLKKGVERKSAHDSPPSRHTDA